MLSDFVRLMLVIILVDVQQVRSTANISHRAFIQAQISHLSIQLLLKRRCLTRAIFTTILIVPFIFRVFSILSCRDLLRDPVEALAGPYLPHQIERFMLLEVE